MSQKISTHRKTENKSPLIEVDTLIIGAGASGLFCAMQLGQQYLADNQHKKIVVIDHANKAGKKILMSGGGKCNFTNYFVTPENYISQNPHFCKSALSRYTNWDFITLVEKHHIAYEERKHGQLFCLNSAKDILAMLLSECADVGVSVQCKTSISNITATKNHTFYIQTDKNNFHCQKLVIATGGLSIPTMGATGFGYDVAKQFRHNVLPVQAGLVPFIFTDDIGTMIKNLSGNAIDVIVSNQSAEISFQEAMLFTHRGLSGPVMLQLSNYWQSGDSITINLIPNEDMPTYFLQKKQHSPKVRIRTLLNNHLPKSVVLALENRLWSLIKDKPLADISNAQLETIGKQLNHWQIKPSGTEGYRTAEVTLGGICVDDISSKSMQSKLQPNLYFIGEVLDVTGWLGGYNFQWAWSSAYVCAEAMFKNSQINPS